MGIRRGVREFEAPKDGQVVDSRIEKFEPGAELEGLYREMRTGNFGPLADFEMEDGSIVTFGVPAILETRLKRVGIGSRVLIQCIGTQAAKVKGYNDTLLFEVYVLAGPNGAAAKSEPLGL